MNPIPTPPPPPPPRAPSPAHPDTSAHWIPRSPAALTLTGHTGVVSAVAFHPVLDILVSASEDATVRVWNWRTGALERTLDSEGHRRNVNGLDFDSRGELLATASSDLDVRIWSVKDEWKIVKVLTGHEHTVSAVRFMVGDDRVMTASRDRTVRIFDVFSGEIMHTMYGHTDWVRDVMPSRYSRLFASCSSDQTAQVTDWLTGETKMEFVGHATAVETVVFVPSVAYAAVREYLGQPIDVSEENPADAYIATGARDHLIKLWDVQTGQCIQTLVGHDKWVRALAFHPSGKYLLSASDDGTVRIWELATGVCIKTLQEHQHFVVGVAWGRQVASSGPVDVVATCSVDKSIKIWRP